MQNVIFESSKSFSQAVMKKKLCGLRNWFAIRSILHATVRITLWSVGAFKWFKRRQSIMWSLIHAGCDTRVTALRRDSRRSARWLLQGDEAWRHATSVKQSETRSMWKFLSLRFIVLLSWSNYSLVCLINKCWTNSVGFSFMRSVP